MSSFNPFHFWGKPHPYIFNRSSLLIVFLATFFLLFFLKPLGYQLLTMEHRALLACGNAIIATFGVWISVNAIRKLFPNWSRPEEWTIGKELTLIICTIFLIALLTFMLMWSIGFFDEPVAIIFKEVIGKTIVISIIPVVLLVLFEQYGHQRQKLKQAMALTAKIKEQITRKSSPSIVEIKNENGSIALRLAPSELVFIQSDGNYLEVFYYQKELKKQLVRNSLKAINFNLPLPQFFHCHKSYLVNLQYVVHVSGNARNLLLTLRYVQEPIPVSRAKTKALEERLGSIDT